MSHRNNITVLTLDAGGTNYVFQAIRNYEMISGPLVFPSSPDSFDQSLQTIISGFEKIAEEVGQFDMISFGFPGPADYEKGVLGDLPNFAGFKKGMPLGPILSQHFKVPVFINNDGNLFALGESEQGLLKEVNDELNRISNPKRYQNLIGITLGTGIGCGIVVNGHLLTGDNFCAGEIHNMSNLVNNDWNTEETVSIRGIQNLYQMEAGLNVSMLPSPKDIYSIAKGEMAGNQEAAMNAFTSYGRVLGNTVANVITLLDGIVVLGGGLVGAWELFSSSMFDEIHRKYKNKQGVEFDRLSSIVFNLEVPDDRKEFFKNSEQEVMLPNTSIRIDYNLDHKVGVGISKLGISKATALGAYSWALKHVKSN